MPAKTKPSPKGKNDWGMTFVNFRLGKEEKDEFKAYMSAKPDILSEKLAIFIGEGHKVSLSWDDNNKCFIGSATCKDEGSINNNHCMTSRSDDWFEALMMNVYKANELAAGTAWSDLSESADWG